MSTVISKGRFLTNAVLLSALTSGCTLVPGHNTVLNTTTTQTSSHVAGVPGGVVAQQTTMVATIERINHQTREVTLVDDQRNRKVLRISSDVPNLEQFKQGDIIKVAYAEELVVYVKERGAPPSPGTNVVSSAAPKKEQTQLLVAGTKEQVAVVKALDLEHRVVTLRFPDGGERTYLVREDVKLDKKQIGQSVVFRHSEALGISVEPR